MPGIDPHVPHLASTGNKSEITIMELHGKIAFVTGAAKRIGRALAEHLHTSGCELVVHYFRSQSEALQLQKQIGCRLFQADFSTISIDTLRDRLTYEIGPVDVLINNASSFHEKAWGDIDESFWNAEFNVNLKIPFFLSHHFGRQMKTKGAGKIINFADIAAERSYLKYLPYSLAKSGLISITEALAKALAPHVQVNAIAPGTILFPEGYDEPTRSRILEKIPMKRTGTVEEVVRTVDFLLTGVDYITGQVITLDGGRTLTW